MTSPQAEKLPKDQRLSKQNSEDDMISKLMQLVLSNSFEPGNSLWVDVTHINNPDSFYVRPTVYRRYLNEIEAFGEPVNKDLQMRATVVYNSQRAKKHIRGFIISIESKGNKTYDIFASDYGFVDKSVELKDIFEPIQGSCVQPLAVQCRLADCVPLPAGSTWTDREINAMKDYVGEERAKMFVREKCNDVLTVELINSMPDDIATMLALTGFSTYGYAQNTVSQLTSPKCEKLYFTFKELKPNDILKVRLQSGKELNAFYVAEFQDYNKVLNESADYTYFSRQLKNLCFDEFVVDTAVGVYMFSSNKYERGIIKEVLSDSRARVQLVDWGRIVEVHISVLKPMSEKFFNYPVAALYCSVTEKQMAEPGLQKYMYPGYSFSIEIIKVGYRFTEPNIVKIIP